MELIHETDFIASSATVIGVKITRVDVKKAQVHSASPIQSLQYDNAQRPENKTKSASASAGTGRSRLKIFGMVA